MSYIHQTKDHVIMSFVGDRACDYKRIVFCDASLAGDLTDCGSILRATLCLVGLALIFMGISVITNYKKVSANKTKNKNNSRCRVTNENKLPLKAFLIGLLHGAAGSGVIITIITTKIESISLKFTYIALFSLFLIISMALLSILMSMPLQRKMSIFPMRYLNIGIGTMAVLVGVKMLYEFSLQMNALLSI